MAAAMTWLKRALPLSRRAKIVARTVPAKFWFRCARGFSRLQGRATRSTGSNGRLTELLMLDHWLRDLTNYGAFPIEQRIHGKQYLERYADNGPVIFCSTHLAMFEVCLRSLVELGHAPVAVAHNGRIVGDRRFPVIGLKATLAALPATRHVMTQMRSVLQGGQSVACMADREYLDTELSSNLLSLAGRLRVPVIFTWAKLGADDVFDVMIQPAPHPYCESEAAIEENMRFLSQVHGEIRRSLGLDVEREFPEVSQPEVASAQSVAA